MALTTTNIYGNINISDQAVAIIVSRITLDCYGVVELASRRLSDSIMILFNKEPLGKGVKIVTMDNRIFVELYVILKDGVNREAVIESLRSSVQYNVEHLTGMRVKSVIIHVVGVKL
ncbi:MAG: Asp23/Gls24 family envelope stress response protein [Firmicutes bacterium]|uniref:Asp23/Gls24 family envelope stress response protein n=1 Tax=Candidatus Stercoripulliclostridium pullicola TaxID=2840953 RepID=A0A940IDS7_9FIRM|nr:Asp23/Gls24 family envelope stress response protein [Candidatus Stercoripulliclostridium pullicola]